MNKILKLAAFIIICEILGSIGAIFTAPAIPIWYASLQKPAFTPPSWVFAPVWATLFLLMGIALFLVWEKRAEKREARLALYVFGVQFALNIIWSLLFFGLRAPFLAFIEIIILWISILATMVLFYRVSKPAGVLFVPYLAWVTAAALLNYGVWVLNG